MKRLVLATIALISLVGVAAAWIGYGNPFRDIPFSGQSENYDMSQAFFIKSCDKEVTECSFDPEYEQVIHFSFGDGVMGHPRNIAGKGRNPIALARSLGLKIIPAPDFEVAAVKWCTSEEIFQVSRSHGRHFILPITSDPLETARCVRELLPRKFDVFIGDPELRTQDRRPFASLLSK